MASTYASALPFYDLDDESFLLCLYEFENGTITYDEDKLSSLFFNPLLLKNKHHFALNYNLDPDENFLHELNNTSCDYYVEDQFNEMLRKEFQYANSMFSTKQISI